MRARARVPRLRAPLRILLAEDNAVNQKLALRQLQKLGYAAQAVGNGAEVLQEVQRSDLRRGADGLPDAGDGWLRSHPAHPRVREAASGQRTPVYIIAITAHALDGDRERCLSAGMNDYLTKPLHIAQFDAALNRAGAGARVGSRAALDPVCVAGLKELREPGQPDPLVELGELFARESAACVQRLEQGLAEKDSALATRAAHSLKGSSSNLGAHRLAALCAAMEQAAKNSGVGRAPRPIHRCQDRTGPRPRRPPEGVANRVSLAPPASKAAQRAGIFSFVRRFGKTCCNRDGNRQFLAPLVVGA